MKKNLPPLKRQISLLTLMSLVILLVCSNVLNAQNQTAKVTPGGTWYYEYLPPDYNSNTNNYPIVFFLHGLGERGDTEATLPKVAQNGPPKYVKAGYKFPFILISPQLKSASGSWSNKYIDAVIEYCRNNLRVDQSRIYLTGLSLGGGGTWGYAQDPILNQKLAAIAVACGHQNNIAKACNIVNSGIPVWAFHGDADNTVPYTRTVNMINAINACDPAPNPKALITIYPGVGHNCWDNAYRTDNSLHNPNVYEWLLQYKNGGVKVNTGADFSLNLPLNSTNIVGSATTEIGSITSYTWTKESGPAATIANAGSSTVSLSNLVAGIYTFRLTASNGTESSYDEVKVTVASLNQPPVANAGLDKSITLPTNSLNIVGQGTDVDGTIKSYVWNRVSGPSAIGNQTTATLSLTGLLAGTYVFSLTVTDDKDATASDNVLVVVNPAIVNQSPTASAGGDKVLNLPTNSINITGTGSDPDGSIANYLWEKISGPTATIVNGDAATVSLSALVAGAYVFQLTVTDNKGATGTDLVSVTVIAANQSPTAFAGDDINLTWPTNSTNITGSGSDLDGSIKNFPDGYLWSQVSGPVTAQLTNKTSSTLTCSALEEGKVYVFRLTVTDNNGATGSDDVKVTVNSAPVNNPPVASAGIDKSITLPLNIITLTGSGSDIDGSISPAGYSWTKLSGPAYIPSNENTESLTASNLVEGTYIFQFTVTDDKGAIDTDEMTLTVQPAAVNSSPVAIAGDNVVITSPINSTTLTGSGTDSDGTIATYSWLKLSGPAATLVGASSNVLELTNLLLAGEYVFQLTVTDDGGAIDTDEVSVFVNAANVPPTALGGLDITITSPASATPITGSGTDVDGTIAAYLWEYVSGSPGAPPTLVNENTNVVSVSDLLVGTYLFKLTVTDDDGDTGTDEVKVIIDAAANQTPTANAGNNKSITLPTSSENFTGSGTDLDGTIATYSWTLVSKPPTAVTDPTLANEDSPTVTVSGITVPGSYVYNLEVTDDDGATGSDQVTLLVNPAIVVNKPPTVSAGTNQSIQLPINSTNLNGSASDVDGSIASYKWTFVSGPSTIAPTNNDKPTATVSGLLAGTYKFRLTVKDDKGLSASATVSVFVSPANVNKPPVAKAGDDQILVLLPPPDNSLTIFGSGSDPDGSITSYQWTMVSKPPLATDPLLSNQLTSTLTVSNITLEGVYVFKLTVTDNNTPTGATASDNVTLTVNAASVNKVPVANAGDDQVITLPTNALTINGSGSDANQPPDVLTYAWSLVTGPSFTIVGTSTQPKLQLSNLIEGQYTFRLEVSDGKDSDTDDVIVNVNAKALNQSPVVTVESDQIIFLPVAATSTTTACSGSASDDVGVTGYLWSQVSGPNTATLVNKGSTTLTANNLIAGVYKFRLTATDIENATGSDVIQVTVNGANANQPPTVNGGNDLSFKLPAPSTITKLTAVGFDPEGLALKYTWEKEKGPSCSPFDITQYVNNNSLSLSNLKEGIYQFKITVTDTVSRLDQVVEKAIDSVSVTVLPASINLAPVVSAGDDIEIQLPINTATLTGTVTDDGTTTVSWTQVSGLSATLGATNSNTLLVSGLSEGTYTFKFTAVDDGLPDPLSNSDEVSVVVTSQVVTNPPPVVEIKGDSLIELPVNAATLTAMAASPNGFIESYKWKMLEFPVPATITSDTTTTLQASSLKLGVYKFGITVKDELGQEGYAEKDVKVLDGPSDSFSPNNDTKFDTWSLPAKYSDPSCDIKVYNRSGASVYHSLGYPTEWDGTFNGQALPEGVYFYVIRPLNQNPIRGSVTIIR